MVFLFLYLVTSIIVGDFYKVPVTVAFLVAAVYAIVITPGTIGERVELFSRGAGEKNIMLMLWIFLLAGAFAASAKSMGAVDATVNATLRLLPSSLLLPGIFIASCFISLSIGTSVGTIAALAPVAVGIADKSGTALPLMLGIVVGGAYFGDNLSFISDTTIVATQTQGCKMSDKFRVNSRIVFPIALAVVVIYGVLGMDMKAPEVTQEISLMKIVPYVAVVVAAVCGVDVMLVLAGGLLLTGAIGMADGSYDIFGWFSSMADGMMGMSELIIMTLLAAGMLSMIRHNGGIDYIIKVLTRNTRGKKGAEACIALLACLVNICTANNTVALVTAGPIASDIAWKYCIDRRKSASLLDTASCFTQGLLPYGAQMLIASSLTAQATQAAVSPVSIVPYTFYPMGLGLAIALSIALGYPKKYS